MHPGSLPRLYDVCGKPNCRCKDPEHPRSHSPYCKLSYAHNIRKEALKQVRAELSNSRQFRRLTARWIDLALKPAKLKLTLLP
jgi:hypothetical protein